MRLKLTANVGVEAVRSGGVVSQDGELLCLCWLCELQPVGTSCPSLSWQEKEEFSGLGAFRAAKESRLHSRVCHGSLGHLWSSLHPGVLPAWGSDGVQDGLPVSGPCEAGQRRCSLGALHGVRLGIMRAAP